MKIQKDGCSINIVDVLDINGDAEVTVDSCAVVEAMIDIDKDGAEKIVDHLTELFSLTKTVAKMC